MRVGCHWRPQNFYQGGWSRYRNNYTGWIRSKQDQLRLPRKAPQLAPPELETARACVKSTHHAWFWCALLIWTTSTSPDQKRDFSLIPKSNIFVFHIRANIFNQTLLLTIDDSWGLTFRNKNPWRPLQVLTPILCLKIRSKPSQHVISVIDLTSMDNTNYRNFDL